MKVIEHIKNAGSTIFSCEILPPLKGNDINKVFKTVDTLLPYDPKFITITTHRDEIVYKSINGSLYERRVARKRPGTVAVAAAILNKYKITVVPHIICKGFTKSETEYALIDLNFLNIHDLLCLRGDDNKKEGFPPLPAGEPANEYALDLVKQVNELNLGNFLDGSLVEPFETKFSYGVACYPEKHESAPNLKSDIEFLKMKVDAGADFIITQMFFDNQKYYNFVEECRKVGITIPIIPGLKPITVKNQLTVLPHIFRTDIPEAFACELRKCKTDEEVVEVGIEWCTEQAKDLKAHGVPVLHFYTMMAVPSVARIAASVF